LEFCFAPILIEIFKSSIFLTDSILIVSDFLKDEIFQFSVFLRGEIFILPDFF